MNGYLLRTALVIGTLLFGMSVVYAQETSDPSFSGSFAQVEDEYNAIRKSDDIAVLEAFIAKYPDSVYAKLAQVSVDALTGFRAAPLIGTDQLPPLLAGTLSEANETYPVILEKKGNDYLVEYPSLNCGGIWQRTADFKQISFTEIIKFGLETCIETGHVIMTPTGPDSFSFEWRASKGAKIEGRGELTTAD